MASALYGPAEIPVGARTHCPQKALWKAVQVQRDMRSNTDTGLQESSIVMSMSNITPGDRKINLNTATMFDYSTASKVKIKTLAAYLNLNYFKKRLKTKNHLPKSTFILLVWVLYEYFFINWHDWGVPPEIKHSKHTFPGCLLHKYRVPAPGFINTGRLTPDDCCITTHQYSLKRTHSQGPIEGEGFFLVSFWQDV